MRSSALRHLAFATLAAVTAACGDSSLDEPRLARTAADAAGQFEAQAIQWFDGELDAAFRSARNENKPVFLYWGAAWCPYCRDLEAHVFTQPAFVEKLGLFVPVRLDGDEAGAQRAAETFGVAGYPTVLALTAEGEELVRIAGGMELSRYTEVLDLALGELRPIGDLLASPAGNADMLSADECRRLAYNGWALDDVAPGGHGELAAALAQAAASCPVDARVERARLTAIALSYAAGAERAAIEAGGAPGATLAGLLDALRTVLDDAGLTLAAADALRYLDADFFAILNRVEPDRAQDWLALWSRAMDAAAADTRYTEGNRVAALDSKLRAHQALGSGASVPPELAREALQHIDDAFERAGHTAARAGLVNAAINLLDTLGRHEHAYALAEEEMARSRTPYYQMATLAALDERLGRPDSALQWYARAYRESEGAATRFQWGTNYVRALIRLQPDDEAGIRNAAIAVIAELDGPDRIYRRSRTRLDSLEADLREWNADGAHDEAIGAIRERMRRICGDVRRDEHDAMERCVSFLSATRN